MCSIYTSAKRFLVSTSELRTRRAPSAVGGASTRPPGANDEAQRIAILVLLALGSRSTALCRQLAGPLEQAGRRDPRSRSFHLPPETQYVVQEALRPGEFSYLYITPTK